MDNKYLTMYKNMVKHLMVDTTMPEYEIINKLLIANELDYVCDNFNDDIDNNIPSGLQEQVIDIIYDMYMNLDADVSIFSICKASYYYACYNKQGWDNFVKKYKEDALDFSDNIYWRL